MTGGRDLLDRRLVIVTGKGGTGKTTVAVALAEAARRAGRRVVLAETGPREEAPGLFEPQPARVGYEGREMRPGLRVLQIDPHRALAEYLGLQFGFRGIAERVLATEAFQQLLEAAPGWRELIILGKVWHLEQEKGADGRPLYDLVIVDAPATGHGLTFLDVPRVVQQAVRSGPLARHAGWVEELVHDRDRTLLLPVTLPEELPMLETCELIERNRTDLGIAVDRVILNRMPDDADAQRAAPCVESLADDLDLEVLPPADSMRRIFSSAMRRTQQAARFAEETAQRCDLPIVFLPEFEAADAAAGHADWEALAEAILDDPIIPANDTADGAEPNFEPLASRRAT